MEELVTIVRGQAVQSGFECAPDVLQALLEFFEVQPRDRSFGDARPARQTVDGTATRQATMQSPDMTGLKTLTLSEPAQPPARA